MITLILYRHSDANNSMLEYPNDIDRNSQGYQKKHYRAHWQPVWAYLGVTLCSMLLAFGGWSAIFNLCDRGGQVSVRDSVIDLTFTYTGVGHLCICSITIILQFSSR